MAISGETILAMLAVVAIGVIFAIKILPKFKEAIKEVFPYPRMADFLTTTILVYIILQTTTKAFELFGNAGILTRDLIGWLLFVNEGLILSTQIIRTFVDFIYYLAIFFVGYAILQIAIGLSGGNVKDISNTKPIIENPLPTIQINKPKTNTESQVREY
jgi:hypothetical protein